jgi:hypothetical protein
MNRIDSLEDRFPSVLITLCAYQMRWLGSASLFLNRVGKACGVDFLQAIFFFLSVPFFKASHLFFKGAYALQQRRLRLLCGDDFFLKVYDRRVADGSVVDILKSLRHIEGGLKCAESGYRLTNHFAFSSKENASRCA